LEASNNAFLAASYSKVIRQLLKLDSTPDRKNIGTGILSKAVLGFPGNGDVQGSVWELGLEEKWVKDSCSLGRHKSLSFSLRHCAWQFGSFPSNYCMMQLLIQIFLKGETSTETPHTQAFWEESADVSMLLTTLTQYAR